MDLTAYSDQDLIDLRDQIANEQVRRSNISSIPQTILALNSTFLAAQGTEPGQDWRQPQGAYDAYPEGWHVNFGGKVWESLTPSNVWEPGSSGWREAVPESAGPAAWVQPSGSIDAYKVGDRVSFGGAVYESLIAANVWSPTGYPAGWKLIPA